MSLSHVLSLRQDVKLVERPSSEVALQGPQIDFVFNPLPTGVLAALRKLLADGATEQELSYLVTQEEGISVVPYLYLCLYHLNALNVICRTIRYNHFPLATLIPISSQHHYQGYEVIPDTPYVLSRFVYCRQENNQIVLESPLAHEKVVLHNWQASALWAELKVPRNCYELSQVISGVSVELVEAFLNLLLNAQMLVEAIPGYESGNNHPAVVQWEFHDLLFHSRSRLGRHANPYGGTYRFLGKIEPLPVVKPESVMVTIPLFEPDIQHLQKNDLPFTYVLEQRRSIRQHGERPLTQQQLGEFLFRTARVKLLVQSEHGHLSNRPYPSGGAIYELELYTVINQCADLSAGLYHYCPQKHELAQICDLNPSVQTLLEAAWHTTERKCRPQVLIIITARFPKVSWKYQSMAYALILKHVGVLYQTMYLVATAMGLAPCALGGGDSDLFAQAAGLDYYKETSVGEFILGSYLETD
ncbi:SagB family peptide dehydrogenase [Cylindrospermum sp. FACHB-282]|uniref:SagB family peptide dehydrogenase n=1 Tax=Cylindrospermum sp. FACHB-282 TaxID=2692794 RepID=UPI001681F5D6|nr:SagB family peptide dehydrogenase [Cylindrospermum sp. FACHB-282]MBD2385987.1 SagB family peptide dehydrogenase [Cylindrospermum sp. FACHB-282]